MIDFKTKAKQFRLPMDEYNLNKLYQRKDIDILMEQVFQDKTGDVTVFIKWEDYGDEEETAPPNQYSGTDLPDF